MSSGHGAAQRHILAELAKSGDWVPITEFAVRNPGDPRFLSSRRAVRRLADEGVVEVALMPVPSGQRMIHARLTR